MSGVGLNSADLATLKELLGHIPGYDASIGLSEEQMDVALGNLLERAETEWRDLPPETVTPPRGDVLGMVLVRQRRQLAYSLKLSNLERDPIAALPALLFTAAGAAAAPMLVVAPPVTFPTFLLGIAFAWLRAFAHPISYGEAALLHYLNQVTAVRGVVTDRDIQEAGMVLVEKYGYVKGQNSNEVTALLNSLLALKAIEHFDGGFRALERVSFGLGPIEYTPR